MSESKPVYVYDEQLVRATDRIPHLRGRGDMVHQLIKAYGLLELMNVIPSTPATIDDLLTFHSPSYIEFLKSVDQDRDYDKDLPDSEEEEFGLGYDCPMFQGMMEFTKVITGGTLGAVKAVMDGAKIAINWNGGWHHAQRDQASGFCYVNDIVIGIQYLLKSFKKILYIDLDSHHGDGVENAFSYSNRVTTVSVHHQEVGYFPGTGSLNDVGYGKGKYYSINVPLKSGAVDQEFVNVFDGILECVRKRFDAGAVIVQCGCDCLTGDPLGNFNLTEKSLVHCVKRVLGFGLPTIFLGGGGYHLTNAAKAWTALTFTILNLDLPLDIPDHAYFLDYGPDFTLEIPPGLKKNENTENYLHSVLQHVQGNLSYFDNIGSLNAKESSSS